MKIDVFFSVFDVDGPSTRECHMNIVHYLHCRSCYNLPLMC